MLFAYTAAGRNTRYVDKMPWVYNDPALILHSNPYILNKVCILLMTAKNVTQIYIH